MAIRRGTKTVPAHRTKAVPSRRQAMRASDFAIPEDRSYPIPDAYHATLALGALLRSAGRHGVSSNFRSRARKVLAAVRSRFPGVYRGEADLVAKVRRLIG
jgi:hypothetical protein